MPLDSKQSRADHAEEVLNDPAVRFALDAMLSEVLRDIEGDKLRWYSLSNRKRDKLILKYQVIKDFESRLLAYIRRA